MRLLICGSRTWRDVPAVAEAITRDVPEIVIHGGCPAGADAIASDVCKAFGIPVHVYLAMWDKHGRAAGPIRNQQMIDEAHPDKVIAFRSTGRSNGTDDMIRRARAAGIEVHVVTPD